jgi:uncharacterized protein (DUF1501 family)
MNDHLTTRRTFIHHGITLLAAGATIPTFLDNTALALAAAADGALSRPESGADGRILVIVQLSGGNDGLNTVVPFADDGYHRARPALAYAGDKVLKLNDSLGLHPNLAALKALYDDGMMSIVQGVGYPNPNRSHFRSMDIWQSAQPEREVPVSGWLGRFFDNTCSGTDPHTGVSLGETLPLAMRGERVTPLAFERPENYRYRGQDRRRYEALNAIADTAPATRPAARPAPAGGSRGRKVEPVVSTNDQLQFLTRTAMDAQVSSDTVLRVTRQYQPSTRYPGNEFGQGLRTVAAMIAGKMPTRVYYVTLGGFDTHANQRGRHEQLMQQFASGVGAFWDDMKHQGNADRVLMMTFSEFGRRVAQNASAGTDHGAAAPMFFFGRSIRPGLLNDHPSLARLDEGDLIHSVDFRQAYAAVLQNWLDTPSKPVLGQQFRPLSLLRST